MQLKLESLYMESLDMEGLQIFAHGTILCPNWTHIFNVTPYVIFTYPARTDTDMEWLLW